MIDGVRLIALTRRVDERGSLMEILRSDAEHFLGFGQAYVTSCEPQPGGPVVKAWHRHAKQYDHFVALRGKAKVGLHDDREGSPTQGESQVVILGGGQDLLLQIPPGVWHGFMALGFEEAVILNLPTECYDHEQPDELRAPWDAFPVKWGVQSR
jgi:dTDP-4-dehydrorhamnose 3,5-epimerase